MDIFHALNGGFMNLIRHLLVVMLAFSAPLLPEGSVNPVRENDQATQIVNITEFDPVLSKQEKQTNPLLQFEYLMSSLGTYTHECIDMADWGRVHPILEIPEERQKKIDAINRIFYQENGYDEVVNTYKFDPEKGINAALPFMHKLANVLNIQKELPHKKEHIPLEQKATLLSIKQKVKWLKELKELIKNEYLKLTPLPKREGWWRLLKRWALLNPAIKNINLAELNGSTTLVWYLGGVMSAGKGSFEMGQKLIQDGTIDGWSLAYLGAAYALVIGGANINGYIAGLENEKLMLLKRDQFIKDWQKEKREQASLHEWISYHPKKIGFKKIEGIQNDAIIQELSFFANWLSNPIRYFGNRLAIMLYGEPGNGKGIITRALADEGKTPLISIDATDIQNGNVIKKLRASEYCSKMRAAKSIIVFFDEIDLLLDSKNKGVLHALLTLLDGVHQVNPHVRVLYIFATNHIEQIDKRLLRPGRFKSKIYIGPPTPEQRYNLIKATMQEVFKGAPQRLVEQLTQLTEGLSRVAIHEVILNTYNHVILTQEPSTEQTFLREIEKIKEITYHSSEQIA